MDTSSIVLPTAREMPDQHAGIIINRLTAHPESGITARERQVIGGIAFGASNATIADWLILGENTIKTHIVKVAKKLGTNNRTQLAIVSLECGLLNLQAWKHYMCDPDVTVCMSPQRAAVLRQLERGLNNHEIGTALDINPLTVKNHLAAISAKLLTGNRTVLASISYAYTAR